MFKNTEHEFKITWPNKFSKFIGDKTFGLIIADYLGLNVPFTTVISREVAPFTFGIKTGLFERWIRTCPIMKEPGKYYTGNQWVDPFILMKSEESKGNNEINIAAILSQDAVEAKYSGGAIITKETESDIIEGVQGSGEQFMLGQDFKVDLPGTVMNELKATMDKLRKHNKLLGDISIEWVYDNKKIWVVQLNQIIKNKDIGIELVGNIGITSHFGDLLRQSNIPSRMVEESENN